MFQVVFHNDDFTTMEFVVLVLTTVFHHSQHAAERLMLLVHNEGKAVVGVYSYDMAMSKTNKTMRMAREAGFPLLVTCEPVE